MNEETIRQLVLKLLEETSWELLQELQQEFDLRDPLRGMPPLFAPPGSQDENRD